jgi:arylamine N-acetyltransferase
MTPIQITDILAYLGVKAQPPSLPAIDELLSAYTRKVPWESMSRIARKSRVWHNEEASLMPSAFWKSAIAHGTGGTCYESNYAFLTLLRGLGYVGYLTINNMGDTIGCHSAIILTIENLPYLVDVGMPFHVAIPLPIHPTQKTSRLGQFHTYSITPQGDDIYIIERDNHPNPYCYTLINKPIKEDDYQQILINDYGDGGLFLDRAIVTKVIDDRVWRFDSQARPFQIEIFVPFSSDKLFQYVGKDVQTVAPALSQVYGMNLDIIHTTLTQVI